MNDLYTFLTKREADFIDQDFYGDEDGEDFGPKPKTCKYCGEAGLFWTKKDGKWRLGKLSHSYADGVRLHVCKKPKQ